MEIPSVRGMISTSRGGNVMPMEKFVSCVGDLVTLVSWVGRDLGPATPLVYVLFFLSFLFARRWGVESFTPALFFAL